MNNPRYKYDWLIKDRPRNRLAKEKRSMIFIILDKIPPRYNQCPRGARSAEILKETKIIVVPVIIFVKSIVDYLNTEYINSKYSISGAIS